MATSSSYTVNDHDNAEKSLQLLNERLRGTTMDDNETIEPEYTEAMPFNNEDDFTDLVLVVEGQQLYTNRSLLAFASPVFSCMFTSEFKEKTEKEITLPDKGYESIRDMLAFLHPGVEQTLTRDIVFRLIPLAEEYQIHVLKSTCEEFLLNDIQEQICPITDCLVKCLEVAEKCSLIKLTRKCMDLFADPDVPLKELKESSEISLQTKASIFEERISKLEHDKQEMETWKTRVNGVRRRLREIVYPHDDHCRCRVEVKLRCPIQRSCPYCSRTWCSDNISTDAYRNSYQFYCNHKVGYHIAHDATVRTFLEHSESQL